MWQYVEVREEHATCPKLTYNFCDKQFSGGTWHIRDHLLKRCRCCTPTFLQVKKQLEAEQHEKDDKKMLCGSEGAGTECERESRGAQLVGVRSDHDA